MTIEGRKLWKNTPAASREHLPAVTFALDQYVMNGDEETLVAEEVATLTVSEWADKNVDGTYSFTFTETDEGDPLPRYNDEGKLYIYELREDSIQWVDSDLTDEEKADLRDLFASETDKSNTYLMTNTYNSPKGELYVRKHLALPEGLDTEGDSKTFPSIQFVLTRSYSVSGQEVLVPDTVFNKP